MLPTLMVILFGLLFAGTHIGLEVGSVKSKMVAKLGDKGFKVVYSLISIVTLGGAIWFLRGNQDAGWIVWRLGIVGTLLGILLIASGLKMVILGFMQPSPTGMFQLSYEPKGIQYVTRHPVNMGIAFIALGHMLANERLAPIALFASLFITGFFGAYHQDMRKKKELGEKFASFAAKTSVMPMAAIVTGKAKISDIGFNKPALAVIIVAFVLLVVFHGRIFGVPLF